MNCSRCGHQLSDNSNFCQNCGNIISQQNTNFSQPDINTNQAGDFSQQPVPPYPNQQPSTLLGKISKITGIASIILVFVLQILIIPFAIVGLIFGYKNKKLTNKIDIGIILNLIAIVIAIPIFILYDNILPDSNTDNNDTSANTNAGQIKGQFSREIFSGKSFDYKTSFDNAVFTFKADSTFECAYTGGTTYKGKFEVYNGLNITAKATKIAADSNIKNAEALADDIRNVSTSMMSDSEAILNTYLLYLQVSESTENGHTDSIDILQPFLIKYDPSTNTGTAVNILGRTQGSFTLK
jgi:hypothetical protein